jgi:hypothetical protein
MDGGTEVSTIVSRVEPSVIVIGETLEWEKAIVDYPPSDGWSLSYAFRGAGAGFDVTATDDNDVFQITVTAAVTVTLTAGTYYWQGMVTRTGIKHLVGEGQSLVKAGLAATATGTAADLRSFNKKTIDAIDAMMGGKATADVQEYTIGIRQLKHISVTELISLREHYSKLYSAELRRARGGGLRTINIGFDRPR